MPSDGDNIVERRGQPKKESKIRKIERVSWRFSDRHVSFIKIKNGENRRVSNRRGAGPYHKNLTVK